MADALTSYLDGYAEGEVRLALPLVTDRFDYAIVIPAFEEAIDFAEQLLEPLDESVLLILVANTPCGEDGQTVQMVRHLKAAFEGQSAQHLHDLTISDKHHVLLIDRTATGVAMPEKQGVGLARKIGADVATALICAGKVRSPYIFNTDADTQIPAGYFRASHGFNDVALIYPFRHSPDPGLELATKLYDLSLDYYVQGLRWAGSHYGYHSIGSTIAIHHRGYAEVRGFPKRLAGEDFYLLNKLAKSGSIRNLERPTLSIRARQSNRTPFGTGRALANISALSRPIDEYRYYDVRVFVCLKLFLDVLPRLGRQPDWREYLAATGDHQPVLEHYIETQKIIQKIHQAHRQYTDSQTFGKFLIQWFDAFRTLKFIHFLRDNHYPSVRLHDLLNAIPILEPGSGFASCVEQLHSIAQERKPS